MSTSFTPAQFEEGTRGLESNPVDHPDGPHEYCEGCHEWFPEAKVEFYFGKYRCPACRRYAIRREHRTSYKPLTRLHDGKTVYAVEVRHDDEYEDEDD